MFTNNVYVTVNGFPLHGTDSNGSEWIVNQTDGFLDGAPSTLATTQKIWSHGVFTNQPFYGGRVVSLEGYVRGTTTENAILSWDSLKQALSLDTQDVIIDWRGYKRLLRGKQSGQPLVEWFDKYTLKFSLEFTSNTPFLYSAGGVLSGSTYLPHTNGGMTFPYAFEGDGTVNLSTHWTGTPDASTSTLSQDGQVVATNLVTSPKPLAAGWLETEFTDGPVVTKTDTPDGMAVSAHDGDSDSFASIANIPCNPDTTYHIVADLARIDGPTWPNGPLFVVEWTTTNSIAAVHTAIGGVRQGILQADFTTQPTTTSINIRLYAPLDVTQQTVWRHIGLYTASDWQSMQALGIRWFDGDLYPGHWVNDWGFPEESTSGSITLNSHGTASSPVIITISGYVVNPRIEHRQTGAALALNYTIPVGETVVLNGETREVLINGKIPSQQIVSSRQWFNAGPGENTFMFSADNVSNDEQGEDNLNIQDAPEYILNGSFTDGTNNWALKPNIDIVNVSGRGNVLHAVLDKTNERETIAQNSVGQQLGYSARPRTIRVGWDYCINSRSLSKDIIWRVTLRDTPNGSWLGEQGHPLNTPPLGEWLHFETTYYLPANNTLDQFWFLGDPLLSGDTVDMYIDNISVKDTAEVPDDDDDDKGTGMVTVEMREAWL